MIFPEMAKAYGIEHARVIFGTGEHMVFVVHPGKYVTATCGQWHGSEPLAVEGATVEKAKQALREAVCNCFATEETIVAE